MIKLHQGLIGAFGIVLIGIAATEDVARRSSEHRYRGALESRRQLELQHAEIVATNEQLKNELTRERQRSQELSAALASMHTQLEESVGRLSEENRNSREMKLRMAALQQQLEQVQGELALNFQAGASTKSAEPEAVQLERVIVSQAEAPQLQGRVVSVHHDWNFIVIDLGWDTVHIGDMVSIFRNNQLLAKARVERVQEGVCAATILPEWQATEIRVNDLVRIL